MSTRYKYRTRLRPESLSFGRTAPWSRSSSLSTTLTILLLAPVASLVSCGDNKQIDPPHISSQDLQLRYDYPLEKHFNYRQSIARKEYGTNTGEERLLEIECRIKSADLSSFTAIDSLLYTTSGPDHFVAGLRNSSHFDMQPSGAPSVTKQAVIAAPKPMVPLPGLPVETIPADRVVQEDIPYTHKLTPNARVISSQREREIHTDQASTETTLEEKVMQVIETHHGIDSTPDTPSHVAAREMVSYDSVMYTRSITLSAPNGYLIRSRETKREVIFFPGTTSTGKETTSDVQHGRYMINESVSRMELIEILAARH